MCFNNWVWIIHVGGLSPTPHSPPPTTTTTWPPPPQHTHPDGCVVHFGAVEGARLANSGRWKEIFIWIHVRQLSFSNGAFVKGWRAKIWTGGRNPGGRADDLSSEGECVHSSLHLDGLKRVTKNWETCGWEKECMFVYAQQVVGFFLFVCLQFCYLLSSLTGWQILFDSKKIFNCIILHSIYEITIMITLQATKSMTETSSRYYSRFWELQKMWKGSFVIPLALSSGHICKSLITLVSRCRR